MTVRGAARKAVFAAGTLLVTCAVLSDFLSPNDPEAQNLSGFYAPPTRLHWMDGAGNLHWMPFIYRYEIRDLIDVSYEENEDRPYPLRFWARGWEYRFLGILPASRHLLAAAPGVHFYPLGADALGRDVFARILSGARTSLLVVALGFLFYAAIGLLIGGIAGTAGGWLDAALMRASEFVLALPALYLILALRALLPASLDYWQSVLLIVGTITSVTWPPLARGVRGLILQLRSAVYVEAARSLGGTRWHIFRRHMIPALVPFAGAQTALAAPTFILGEVMLSYLGIGLGEGGGSWGAMLQSVQDPRVLTDFWWNLAPLLSIFVTLLCLHLVLDRPQARRLARISM